MADPTNLIAATDALLVLGVSEAQDERKMVRYLTPAQLREAALLGCEAEDPGSIQMRARVSPKAPKL